MSANALTRASLYAGSAMLVVLLSYISAFYLAPDQMLLALDHVLSKALLFGVMLALWSAVCFLGWWLFHTPPAKRALAAILKSLLAFTIGVGVFAGIGWPQIASVMLSIESGLVIEGAERPMDNPVIPSLAWGVIGLVAIGALYLYAEVLEKKGLIRRVD